MKISNQELIGKASYNLAVLSFVMLISDEILDAALWFIHTSFEFIEYSFELLAENVFNATDKQTEIIGFYLILGMSLYGAYRLFRAIPGYYQKFMNSLRITWLKYKKNTSGWWHMLSTVKKIEVASLSIIGISSIMFLF
jgi:hypothetical protein